MESLGLDIKLLVAQMINFGLLLVILSKFLYKPVIKLLDERKKKIQESLENSKKIEERLIALEEKEKEILQQAQERADKETKELIRLAREERQKIIEESKAVAERESLRGIARIQAEEAQASLRVKKKITDELLKEVVQKLSAGNKKKGGKLPLLEEILQ